MDLRRFIKLTYGFKCHTEQPNVYMVITFIHLCDFVFGVFLF